MSGSIGSYKAVVIGTSSGGVEALGKLFAHLPAGLPVPVMVVQHIPTDSPPASLPNRFQKNCALAVTEAELGQKLLPGHIYFAPPGYHLLVEKTFTLSLDSGERENYARPSIDALFTTAADAYGKGLIGVVLTGANEDGAQGLKRIRALGGYGIIQDPSTAHAPEMPTAALKAAGADALLPLNEIAPLIKGLCCQDGSLIRGR